MLILDTISMFYSRSVIIVCSSFSFSFSLFVGIFLSSLSITEKERRHHFYCCCLFSFSLSLLLSRKYFLLLYIHIYQSEEVRTFTRRFFSSCIGQIWPRHYYYPDSSIRFCVCLRTRIECAYTYTRTKRNHQWYIYKSNVRFSTHTR